MQTALSDYARYFATHFFLLRDRYITRKIKINDTGPAGVNTSRIEIPAGKISFYR